MQFKIIWADSSIKQLQKLERPISKRVFERVEMLKENPYRLLTKVVGEECFKLRVGDYRVLVDVDFKEFSINVLKIDHRKNIYKNL